MTAFAKYRDKIGELIHLRAAAGGDLSDAEEDRFGDELDVHWNVMTGDERGVMERLLAARWGEVSDEERVAIERDVTSGEVIP